MAICKEKGLWIQRRTKLSKKGTINGDDQEGVGEEEEQQTSEK